jgi:very-short-patch-repair endonuclease
VTKPAKTIADLRGAVPEWELRRAIRQAEISGLPLGADSSTDKTRSDLELDFLGLCRRYGIRRPEVNVRIGRWEVDFLWREERLVVETDSYAYHRGRVAFQDDRARDLDLRRRGLDVIRISEQQLNDEPDEVAVAVAQALRRAS